MQKAAHYSAAISILDQVLGGVPAEKALLAWTRSARFAGSKDRATIRDIVFDGLRRRSSFFARFGETGRGLALGRAHLLGELNLFSGEGYAPSPLTDAENLRANEDVAYSSLAEEFDFPQFLEGELTKQYGDQLLQLMEALRERAPVDLRVNRLKTNIAEARDFLARDHIFVEKLNDMTALRILENPRKLASSRAFQYGYVELQDYSSQIASRFAKAAPGMRVLDYCAGGGGKALALSMELERQGYVEAWDINPARMQEIPKRASRSDADIRILTNKPNAQYDLVFVDAPCSGTGAWRRSPDAKWRFTQERLDVLKTKQREVLQEASNCVAPGGILVYATCSILKSENEDVVEDFLDRPSSEADGEFLLEEMINLNPLNAGDGFYAARMKKR